MNSADKITGIGIYLLGHGPYRSPRPIELQFMRIKRYRGLLAAKDRSWPSGPERLFVDINYPRGEGSIDEEAYPAFFSLVEAVQAGQIGRVFFDVEEVVGFTRDYSWVSYLLKRVGAQPVNVFYDPDKVLDEYLDQRFEGQANAFEISDASDFVAFYPALSADIALAALRSVHHLPPCDKVTSPEQIWNELYALKEQSPYARGEEPFLQEDLLQEWNGRAVSKVIAEWDERRKHETLFKLGPSLPGLLVDESSYGIRLQARGQDELEWAEKRVLCELSFEKLAEGQLVSYVRNLGGHSVFADIRNKEKITFYVYRTAEKVGKKLPSSHSFDLSDRFTRGLSQRWQAEFEKTIEAQRGR